MLLECLDAAQEHLRSLEETFREFDRADKELTRLLQNAGEGAHLEQLYSHRALSGNLRQKFAQAARAAEIAIERARGRPDRASEKREIEVEIERSVPTV